MQKILISLVVALLASGTASASEKTDVLAVVHKWLDSFNAGDSKTTASMCTDDAIVMDDFSPHVWQGSGACAAWYKDYGAFIAKNVFTDPKVTLGKAKHLDVDADYAYLVAPTTYIYSKAGKPTKEAGIVTMTLHKTATGWRITGWAWADQ
jgi:ketosteroid isomerase-like protein